MRLRAHTISCGCAPAPGLATDARRQGRDPTGTLDLRSRFRSDLTRRWSHVRRLVLARDLLAHDSGRSAVHDFAQWFRGTVEQIVLGGDGSWVGAYLEQAASRARIRAHRMTGYAGSEPDHESTSTLSASAMHDLRGVIEATVQQSIRALGNGVMRHAPLAEVQRAIIDRVRKIGETRSEALSEYTVVRAFTRATLQTFRSLGVTHVGTLSERIVRGPHGKTLVRDTFNPDQPREPDGKWGSGGGAEHSKWELGNDDVTITHEATDSVAVIKGDGRSSDGRRQVLVTGVATPEEHQGKGGAHAAMNKVETFLDRNGLVARLNAMNIETDVDLHKLYSKHGFVSSKTNKFEMIRQPVAGRKVFDAAADLVEVLTAGDDAVCQECEDISNEGPYELDEAENLIPAHLRCRCAFVPFFDERYAAVEHDSIPLVPLFRDAFDPNQERDPKGRWSSGGGAGKEYVTAYHGTSSREADRIQREGIRVTKEKTYGHQGALYKDSRGRSVYVTSSEEDAHGYATDRVIEREDKVGLGDRPVVFKLRIPAKEWESFRADTKGQKGQKGAAALREKTIPAKWIVGKKVYKPLSKPSKRVSGPFDYLDAATVTAYMVMVLPADEVKDAFDPNQERDDHGRWTGGASGSSATHNAEHMAGLTAEEQAFHAAVGKVAVKHGFREIGTSIVPGDKMFAHKMYRNDKTGERVHVYPHHDEGGNLWSHISAEGEIFLSPTGAAGLERRLSEHRRPSNWYDAFDPDQDRDEHGRWTVGGKNFSTKELEKKGFRAFGKNMMYHREHGYAHKSENLTKAKGKDKPVASEHELDKSLQTGKQFETLQRQSTRGELSEKDKEALNDYTETAYDKINKNLRNGGDGGSQRSDADLVGRDTVRTMDKVFERTSLARAVSAFRSVPDKVYRDLEKHLGKTVRDKGFVSITTNPAGLDPELFTRQKLVRVELPRGARAIPVSHISERPEENELVIRRGSNFDVKMVGGKLTLRYRK